MSWRCKRCKNPLSEATSVCPLCGIDEPAEVAPGRYAWLVPYGIGAAYLATLLVNAQTDQAYPPTRTTPWFRVVLIGSIAAGIAAAWALILGWGRAGRALLNTALLLSVIAGAIMAVGLIFFR